MARTTTNFRTKKKQKSVTPPKQSMKSRSSISTKAKKSIKSESTFQSQSSIAQKKKNFSARTPTVSQGNKAKKVSRKRKSTVLKEIKYYQSNIINLVQKAPFVKTLKTLLMENSQSIQRFSASALDVLQEAMENFLVSAASSGNDLVRHAKRVTLMKKDLELAVKLRQMGPLYKND